MKLLDKAKNISAQRSRRYSMTFEDVELVIAYFNGEINTTQLKKAKNLPEVGGHYQSYIIKVLKYGIDTKIIAIKFYGTTTISG